MDDLCTSVWTVCSTHNEFDTASFAQSVSVQAEEIQAEGQISDLDLEDYEPVLEHKLAALLLCMQSQLQVSQSASQQIIDNIDCQLLNQTHSVQLEKFC